MSQNAVLPATQRGVVQVAPFQIEVRDVPTPKIEEDTDVIVKITASALCGSDLHIYRGHQPPPYEYVMGHEFCGHIVSVGKGVKNFKIGDKVVSPFTVSCGNCYFCDRGWTCRCENTYLYGTPKLPGGQAEYIRVPLADSTLYEAPADIPEKNLILMADIIPTGYFGVQTALNMLNEVEKKDATVAVIGCGPVGLCAVTAAAQRFKTVYAIDSVPERLALAKAHGGIPLNLNEDPAAVLSKLRGGGPDAVLEYVGAPDAFLLGLKLVRVGGVLVSCGVHTHDIQLDARTCYNKNVRISFGRCPARVYFPEALDLLRLVTKQNNLFENFVEASVSLEEAPKYYKLFNDRKIGKVIFV
ncbi:GroES-like protein [Meredithblackwellia eburnea MCA 4105]